MRDLRIRILTDKTASTWQTANCRWAEGSLRGSSDCETRSRDIGFDVIANNVQVGERLPLQARDDVKRQHHAISPAIVAALLFDQHLAPEASGYLIDEKGLLVNPVTNCIFRVELHFHYIIAALVALADRHEGTLDRPVQSVEPHHGPVA